MEEIKDEKYWSFNVKFENKKRNWETFEEFKLFAEQTTDSNYLTAIRNLLLTSKLMKIWVDMEENGRIKRESRKQD